MAMAALHYHFSISVLFLSTDGRFRRPDLLRVVRTERGEWALAFGGLTVPLLRYFGGSRRTPDTTGGNGANIMPTSIMADGTIVYEGEARPEARRRTKKEQQDIISLFQFWDRIPNEEAAIAFVEESIWGEDGPYCPRCGRDNVRRVPSGRPMSHHCRHCNRFFSVRIGTTMEGTNITLRKWLLAIHLMLTCRHGISSIQLSKQLGVSQLTAWTLEQRIREAMKPDAIQLLGIVQADETFVGGKEGNKHADKKLHGHWTDGKIAVFGLREDRPGGRVIAFPIPDTNRDTLLDAVIDNVEESSLVITDGYPGYNGLSELGYGHEKVNHSIGQYVNDNGATTNGIESIWANLKRGYIGIHHYMSRKHLFRYVNELTYRQNAGPGNGFRTMAAVLRRMVGRRLTYEELIAPPDRGPSS
ncbi:MAG: IS1595 family transposase [Chloroflexi bacterium]|nr:IS1595 family transposase [Chloroflexota bacterium]